MRAELIEARKIIKLYKMLDAGVPPSELTASQLSRKAALDAESKEERESQKEKERHKKGISSPRDQSITGLGGASND